MRQNVINDGPLIIVGIPCTRLTLEESSNDHPHSEGDRRDRFSFSLGSPVYISH